jgi:hypothetical protein
MRIRSVTTFTFIRSKSLCTFDGTQDYPRTLEPWQFPHLKGYLFIVELGIFQMKAGFTRASDVSVIRLLFCLVAEVLTACGAGSPGSGQANQTAAFAYNSATNPSDTPGEQDGATRSTKSSGSLYDLFVTTTGSDSNPGSEALPFRTITRAASVAKPSTTIHVAPGTYFETVRTSTSGKPTGRIRYVSESKWGAKIIGSGTEAMWTNRGAYTDIAGFDVSGSGRIGILNWASDTTISSNHVHDLTVSGGCTDNGGAGIQNAEYKGADNDVIGNVIHDVGRPGACNGIHGIYHTNRRGHIFNNIVYRASAFGIHLWHAADNVVIANNTSFANGSNGMGGGILIGSGDSPGGVVLDNTKIINNIVFNNPRASIEDFCYSGVKCVGPNNTVANNLVYGNGRGISLRAGSTSGTIAANPQFVNYQANGTGDYRLLSTSPAIGKGVSAAAPAVDIDNVARKLGPAIDIGPYEHY